jgi:transketolase
MRDAFARGLYTVAKQNPKVFIIVADISPAASMEPYRKDFPDRFADVGVAEQTMIGMCAGLALRGFIPFAYTIATFTIYRPFEQVRDDLCYQNLPVTLVGVGAGLSYPSLGGTHWSQEDVGLMSCLPNMSIIAPCDPAELEVAITACAANKGPTYLRLGKAGEPDLTKDAPEPFQFGKLRKIKNGSGICLISYGPIMKMTLDLAAKIEEREGGQVAVFSAHTLKPLDTEGIAHVLREFDKVIVIEEHSRRNGLGAQTKEIAWDSDATCKLHTFGLKDEYIHLYGTQDDIRRAHGLDNELILPQIL